MIGEDDLADFFDPEEFGQWLTVLEPGHPVRRVLCLEAEPQKSGKVYRSGSDPSAATLRGTPAQTKVQVANGDMPAVTQGVRVQLGGRDYAIAHVEPRGRLLHLLTLVPFGSVAEDPPERGKWRASNSRST